MFDPTLYVPQEWRNSPERCQQAGIPEEVAFRTKPQLALGMIEHALAKGLPVIWVTGDVVYGNNSKLRTSLENAEVPYVLGVSSQETVSIGFEFWRAANSGKTYLLKPGRGLVPEAAVRENAGMIGLVYPPTIYWDPIGSGIFWFAVRLKSHKR